MQNFFRHHVIDFGGIKKPFTIPFLGFHKISAACRMSTRLVVTVIIAHFRSETSVRIFAEIFVSKRVDSYNRKFP